jgi:hypothetical protein
MKTQTAVLLATLTLVSTQTRAGDALFDFNDPAIMGHSIPTLSLTDPGTLLTATFTGTGAGYYIGDSSASGFYTPAGFSGQWIVPKDPNAADLNIQFSQTVNFFSIGFSPHDNNAGSATVAVDAFLGNVWVGSMATIATPDGSSWPSGTLTFQNLDFDNVRIWWVATDAPAGEGWTPNFLADNMRVTTAGVPGAPDSSNVVVMLLCLVAPLIVAGRLQRKAQAAS